MSVQNVKAFFEKVWTSEALRAELKGAGCKDRTTAVEAIIRIATNAGFPFTADEYDQATRSHIGPPGPHRK
ncbi:MAG: Nif11-like leader peptide family natural product precursor [Pirellulaceae bacterium]|nr:Nif11-like leader peptide family natural product precursor [Planctomycetales bacterium]